MKYLFIILIFISLFPLKSQHFRLEKAIDSIAMVKQMKYKIPGLSIAVVQYDNIIYNKGLGVRNIDTKQAVDSNTLFHTASLSKLFTAQAVVNLVNDGVFSMDEKVITLIPEFKMADPRYLDITIRHLLNHTSGMPDVANYHWSEDLNDPDALKKYVSGLSSIKLKSAPGAAFNYSSMGYEVLGYIIEKVTHVYFAAYMRQNVLRPFEMIHSDFDYTKTDPQQRSSPHTKDIIFKNVHTRKRYPYNPAHSPSSTLNSSSYELALWMKSLLRVLDTHEKSGNLNSTTLRTMLKPSEGFSFMGLGWFIGKMYNKPTYYHFGGDKGFRSYLIVLPEYDLGVVLLANCDYDEDFRQDIVHGIIHLIVRDTLREK